MRVAATLAGCAIAFGVASLSACAPAGAPDDPTPLPGAVALMAVVAGGQPMSVYFTVDPNPRGHIDVRVANALVLPGKHGVFALAPAAEADLSSWSVREQLHGATVPLLLPGEAAVKPHRLDAHTVWMTGSEGGDWACDLLTGACDESADTPELELTRRGPGNGFRLAVEDETLRFRQPHESDSEPGEVVAVRVKEILAVRWIEGSPSADVSEYLDRTFRGRGALHVEPGSTVVDGDLEEWPLAEPLVVDMPWQVSTRAHWTGDKDASFSIAARTDESELCFAGRIRDDSFTPADTLTMVIGRERYSTPVLSPSLPEGDVVIEEEWFGVHYELCLPRPARLTAGHQVIFAAEYLDDDGPAPTMSTPDVLLTAPIFEGAPTGSLALSAGA